MAELPPEQEAIKSFTAITRNGTEIYNGPDILDAQLAIKLAGAGARVYRRPDDAEISRMCAPIQADTFMGRSVKG